MFLVAQKQVAETLKWKLLHNASATEILFTFWPNVVELISKEAFLKLEIDNGLSPTFTHSSLSIYITW